MMYGWIIGLLLMVVLIAAIGKGRMFLHRSQQANSGDSALKTLRKRYAQGEIDKAEFEERKAELEKA